MTKILLVEDDKSLREIYGVRLLAEGYDIVSAGDGEEALAMAIKERPQLIVSDVMMPKISGFDMLDILRSTTETRDIKVIMMTALSSDDQRARGEQLGADRYLVKSQVGIEDVVRTVHEVLGDSGTTQTTAPQAAPISQTTAPQAAPAPADDPALPQPTAPFASPRPATLGERVINPIAPEQTDSASVQSQIEQELQTNITPDEPTPAPQPQVTTDEPAGTPYIAAPAPAVSAAPALVPEAPTPQSPVEQSDDQQQSPPQPQQPTQPQPAPSYPPTPPPAAV